MMVLDIQVLGLWLYLQDLCKLSCTLVVFEHHALNFSMIGMDVNSLSLGLVDQFGQRDYLLECLEKCDVF